MNTLQGFDPLMPVEFGDDSEKKSSQKVNSIFEMAIKATVLNVLKSYTGYYDVFGEAIQNALDATQRRQQEAKGSYKPKIWIDIHIKDRYLRVVDNGIGMDVDEFRFCFRPNISFKRTDGLRGNKGVGATFLAYGFNFIQLQSKKDKTKLSAKLRSGRQWAEDDSGKINRPTLDADEFDVPELSRETSGTSVEIRLTGQGGEKPKDLGWHGATTAQQWFDVLRIATPLGGIYLTSTKYLPEVFVKVWDRSGTLTEYNSKQTEYYYPHEIPNLKIADLKSIDSAINSIRGDLTTRQQKLPSQFKELDCLYEIWTYKDILSDQSKLKLNLTEAQRALLASHQVIIYGAHMHSVRTFDAFNRSLGLREDIPLMRGGLQIASDWMPQGDLLVIPLKRFIGYQQNTHVIVHFLNGTPDLGRKTFQPEIRELAEALAVSVTNCFIEFRWLVRADTGATPSLTPNKELYEWKKQQEKWRDQHPLPREAISSTVSYLSSPQQEQDVIALFHELIGADVIRGLNFFASSSNDKYDALVELNYTSEEQFLFDRAKNVLGVRRDIGVPYQSEPKVLEYKFDFDALLSDLDKSVKFAQHIDLVVCWQATGKFNQEYVLKSLMIDSEGSSRTFFGSTHMAYLPGQYSQPVFEVIVLEELINFLVNPDEEIGRQKTKYNNS